MCSTVVITGCSSGIGLALARQFSSLDFRVIGISRSQPEDRLIFDSFVEGDLSSTASTEAICKKLEECKFYNDTSMVVHCAGQLIAEPALEIEAELANRMLHLHLISVLQINSQLADVLTKNSGKIIIIGSISAAHTAPLLSVYSASKSALKRYAEGLRREVGATGIQVSYVELGNVATEFSSKAHKQMSQKEIPLLNYDKLKENFSSIASKTKETSVSAENVAESIVKLATRKRLKPSVWLGSGLVRSFFFRLMPLRLLDLVYAQALGTAEKNHGE